jgi:hypothetical protein
MNERVKAVFESLQTLETCHIHVRYSEHCPAFTDSTGHKIPQSKRHADRHVFIVEKDKVSTQAWTILCDLHKLREDKQISHIPMLECIRESRLVLLVRSVNYFVDCRKLRLKALNHYLLRIQPVYWKARYGTGISINACDLLRCNSKGENRRRTIHSERLDEANGVILNERHVCCVCKENRISTVFIPCGHAACCRTCKEIVREELRSEDKKCPVCRCKITRAWTIYLP